MICINCSYAHDSLYCPNCGQNSEVPRISFSSVFGAGFSTLTNMDKGILFNIKCLFSNPKILVEDYIRGKRKGIFNPISFLILSITLYLVADSFVVMDFEESKVHSDVYDVGYEAGKFVKVYFKYFWIFSIFLLSLATRLIFGKYNYAEHLAINAFVIGQSTLVGVIALLITKIPLLFNPFVYISIVWITYKVFENKNKKLDIFLQTFSAVIIFLLLLLATIFLIGIIRN